MMDPGSAEIGYLACRVVLGVLFFFQAYDKIFRIGLNQVTDTFSQPMSQVPRPVIYLSVLLTSYIELLAGGLLMIGLLTVPSLYLLAADMILVCIGFSFIKPLWDMQYYYPRFILLLILLFLPFEYNTISVDGLLK